MKLGILIPGLGEAFSGITVRNYAKRLAKEMDVNTDSNIKYLIQEEKFEYNETITHCLSIYSDFNDKTNLEYRLYDFSYSSTLCKEFKEKNAIAKCFLLFLTIGSKSSIIFKRLFIAGESGYKGRRLRLLSFYSFGLLFMIAVAGLLIIPGAITLIEEIFPSKTEFRNHEIYLTIKKGLLSLVSVFVLLFSFFPGLSASISSLATEFSCVHYYLAIGKRKQDITGQLDSLMQFIAEKELKNCSSDKLKIHFHTYSFGSIIGMDYLFPYGTKPAKQVNNFIEGIFTIGCPYEFISCYYPNYFDNRNTEVSDKVTWFNIFCSSDALSSNFRNDNQEAPATFSYSSNTPLPINKKYELTVADPTGIVNFLTLYSLKAHQFYWPADPQGNSCVRQIFECLNDKSWLNDILPPTTTMVQETSSDTKVLLT